MKRNIPVIDVSYSDMLGDGVESFAIAIPDNTTEVTVVTSNKNKHKYLTFLGLTTSPAVKVYRKNRGGEVFYMFNVVKLESAQSDYYDDESELGKAKLSMREYYSLNRKEITLDIINKAHPYVKPALQYLRKHMRSNRIRWDAHSGNWLKCPVTGYVFPYDIMFV